MQELFELLRRAFAWLRGARDKPMVLLPPFERPLTACGAEDVFTDLRKDAPLSDVEVKLLEALHKRGMCEALGVFDRGGRLYLRPNNSKVIETFPVLMQSGAEGLGKGQYDQARASFELAVRVCLAIIGYEHWAPLSAINNLAETYRNQGELNRARAFHTQSLTLHRRVLGEEHPQTLSSINNLALTLQALGDLAAARVLQEEALDLCRKVQGDEHPDTLTSMNNLALVLQAQGDLAAASKLEEQTLKLRLRVLGEEHPATLTSMNNLAVMLRDQGEFAAAHTLQEQTFKLRRKVLGEEHPSTLTAMNNLAVVLHAQGDLAAARTLSEQALALNRMVLGEGHPNTVMSMNNLAETLCAQGDIAGGRRLEEQSLTLYRRMLGEEHPATLTAMNNLAGTLFQQGDLPAARILQEQALELRRKVLGEEHPETLSSMNNLATTLCAQGDLAGGRTLEELSLALHRRVLGEEHPATLFSMSNLAAALRAQGDLAAARMLQEQALARRRKVLGNEHPDTLCSMNNLADMLRANRELSMARTLQEQALVLLRRTLGEEHPDTLTSMNNLALTLHEQGNLAAARTLFEQTLRLNRMVLGEEHSHTLTSMNNFALTLRAQGDLAATAHQAEAIVSGLARSLIASASLFATANSVTSTARELLYVGKHVDCRNSLRALSQRMRDAIDLAEPGLKVGLFKHLVQTHVNWLGICVAHFQDDIPLALAALQGREMASAALEELETQQSTFAPGDARDAFLKARMRVRMAQLQLTVVQGTSGQNSGPDQRGYAVAPTGLRQRVEQARAEMESAYQVYQTARARVSKEYPDYAQTLRSSQVGAAEIAARLKAGEALTAVFALPTEDGSGLVPGEDKAGSKVQRHFALVIGSGKVNLIESPALAVCAYLADDYVRGSAQARGGLRKGVGLRDARGGQADTAESDEFPAAQGSLPPLHEALQAFGAELRNALPGIQHWHLVTHHHLHGVPLQGAFDAESVHLYPSLAFFLNPATANPAVPPTPAAAPLLHVDAADGCSPIPFVRAEAALFQSYSDARVTEGEATLAALASSQPGSVAFFSHGDELDHHGTRQAVVVIDADAQPPSVLDAVRWLGFNVKPRVVLQSCCLAARLDERLGGEPFGLASAMLMRGCPTVIGALAPVPDFYTPLLTGLFWQAWTKGGESDPYHALRLAKQQLRSGDWPDGYAERLRAAYIPVIEACLERVKDEAAAIRQSRERPRFTARLAGWHLPQDIAARYFAEDTMSLAVLNAFVREHCDTQEARAKLAQRIMAELIAERHALPQAIVDHLDLWFVAFGAPVTSRS